MRNSLLVIYLLAPLVLFHANAESCGEKGIYCLNGTTYQTCWYFLWWTEYSSEYYTCEDGTYCNQDSGNVSCLVDPTADTSRVSTTTSTAPASACGAASIRCLDDSIYQTCWWFLWWAKYSSEYYSCETGYACDQEIGCVARATVTTTTVTKAPPEVTTVAPVATTPGCGSYTIYCLNDTTYQTCENVWWWQEYNYYTCPYGTVCNDTSSEKCSLEVITTTTSTTTTTTTTTTTAAPGTSNSGCGSKGIHCINDSAYQNCWYFLWWVKYNSGYTTCEDGTVCDQENGSTNCVAAT